MGEFLNGNGGGFEKHSELEVYKPFYSGRDFAKVTSWAKWSNDGINQMVDTTCPFCAEHLKTQIEVENEQISKVFKKSALSTASAVLEFLEDGVDKGYIKNESIDILRNYIGNESSKDELFAELNQLGIETEYLNKQIQKIYLFKPMNVTHQELTKIENSLKEMHIEKRQISKFYSTDLIIKLVDFIDSKLNDLEKNTGKLKGLFLLHEAKLNKLIGKRTEDINNFFLLAGFPYKFAIEPDGENKSRSYLTPQNIEDLKISNPDKYLSWGEKNAFSLVMFMFEAVSENADLIVLDDPITSFDKDKKFAIIRRLFAKEEISFHNKTVIMLTHDSQPLIDYIKMKSFLTSA